MKYVANFWVGTLVAAESGPLVRKLPSLSPHTKSFLMSLSGMVEIRRLQAKRRFVMPAYDPGETGIPCPKSVRFSTYDGRCPTESARIAPGRLRRNDESKSRLPVDKFRTPRLKAEGHSFRPQWRSLCPCARDRFRISILIAPSMS